MFIHSYYVTKDWSFVCGLEIVTIKYIVCTRDIHSCQRKGTTCIIYLMNLELKCYWYNIRMSCMIYYCCDWTYRGNSCSGQVDWQVSGQCPYKVWFLCWTVYSQSSSNLIKMFYWHTILAKFDNQEITPGILELWPVIQQKLWYSTCPL